MKRTFANLLIATFIALGATAGQGVLAAGDGADAVHRTVMVMGQPMTLSVPRDRDSIDWDWQGEFDYGDAGELLVGSGLSYSASPGFAIGGSYAMAVQSRSLLGVRDVDPASYSVFMRWRF